MRTSWPSYRITWAINPWVKAYFIQLTPKAKISTWKTSTAKSSIIFNYIRQTTSTRAFTMNSNSSYALNEKNCTSDKSHMETTLAKYDLSFDAIQKFGHANGYTDADDNYHIEFTILKYMQHQNLIEYDLFRDISCSIIRKSDKISQQRLDKIMRIMYQYKYLNPTLLINLLEKAPFHTSKYIKAEDCLDMLEILSYQNLQWRPVLDIINDNFKDYLKTTKDSIKLLYHCALLEEKKSLLYDNALNRIRQDINELQLQDVIKVILSIFLLEIENNYQNLLSLLFERIKAPDILKEKWTNIQDIRNLLVIKLCIFYLLQNTHLPKNVLEVIAHFDNNQNPEFKAPKQTKFLKNFSEILQKLQIAHFCHFNKTPFFFDILERDRKIIWNLNTYDRYYANTAYLKSYEKLKKRIIEAMGFIVIDCPYWHWSKMKVKRTRIEYIRMSRYYALRDRREFEKDFEGWSLPYIHQMDPRSKNIYHKGYNPEKPLNIIY